MDAQSANELTPYLCNTNYVISKAMGTGLRRTMTLAWRSAPWTEPGTGAGTGGTSIHLPLFPIPPYNRSNNHK